LRASQVDPTANNFICDNPDTAGGDTQLDRIGDLVAHGQHAGTPGPGLGGTFRLAKRVSKLLGRDLPAPIDLNGRNRHTQQREPPFHAITVQPIEPAGLAVLDGMEIHQRRFELLHDCREPQRPILATHEKHKIIAANVPDEIDTGPCRVRHDLGNVQQYLIATRVPIRIVECLEVIEIQVARHECAPACQPLCNVCLNLAVTWQPRKRIRMFGRLNLLGSDVPKQIDRPPHPEITPVPGDDEIVPWPARSARSHQPADLIEPGSCVNLHRRPIHHARYGFAVCRLRMQWPAQKDEQVVAVNHPDRAVALEYGQRSPRGLVPEQLYHFGDVHGRINARNLQHQVTRAVERSPPDLAASSERSRIVSNLGLLSG